MFATRNHWYLRLTAFSISAVLFGTIPQARALVSLPYTNNFDNDQVGAAWEDPDFVTSGTDDFAGNYWQIVSPGIGGAGHGFQSVTTNSTSTIYNAAIVQSLIPAPLPLVLSVEFRIQTTNTSGNSYIGLASYGNVNDLGVVGTDTQGTFIWSYLQITGSGPGQLLFVNFVNGAGNNTGITISNQVGANLPINTNDVYTLSVAGSYDASSNLSMTLTVTDTTSGASATRSEWLPWSVVAANYTGGNFGIVNRDNAGNAGVQTILHDNFSLSSSVATNYLVSQAENLNGWTLTFSDEFNDSQLNTNKWNTTYMWGGSSARTLPGNDEQEIYWDNQFVETNGVLRIRGDKLDTVWYGSTYHYASGLIDSYEKFGQQYGYFEIRARLPHGNSLWPAFWMLYNWPYWPPEIDILEILDSEENEPHQGAIESSKGAYFAQFYATFNSTTAYHVYSLEWSPTYLTYYLDGQQIGQVNAPTNTSAPMQILANLAIGGLGTVPPDATTVFPAYMDIDYIRVWTRTNASAAIPYSVGYDIGAVGLPGATSVTTNGTATVSGAGLGYLAGGTSDSFQFAAQPISGESDYDYLAEISSMNVASGQAGVMIRQSVDPASQYSAVFLSGGKCILQSRTNYAGAAFQTASVPAETMSNLWLRLYRRGNAITAYQSVDGISWDYIAAVTNDIATAMMGPSVFAGAAVASGSASSLNTVNIGSLNVPATQIILDVADSSGVTITGPWVSQDFADNGGTGGYYGPEYLSDNKVNKGDCSVEFTPTLPAAATYDVYMEWLGVPHCASNTPVTINYLGGTEQLTVNQELQGGEWVYVGSYPFAAGTSGNVTISNPSSTAGYGVIANAVRFVPGPAIPPAPPTIPAPPANLIITCTPSNNQVSLQWNASELATSYNVKRGTASGGPYINIATGIPISSTYFTDTNVVSGAKYYYVVTAVNNTSSVNPSGQESSYSNEAAGMPSVIVDNTGPGVTITGAWIATNATAGYYGANYLEDENAGGGKSVRFVPTLFASGNYDVYMRWTSDTTPGNARATNATVDVNYAGGTNVFSINEQVSDGVWWVYLGTFYFNAGTIGNVLVIDTGANGYVIADAFEFVLDAPRPLQFSSASGQVLLTMQSIAGSNYQLQRSSTLSPAAWQNVGAPQAGTGNILTFTDSGGNASAAKFYRVQIAP